MSTENENIINNFLTFRDGIIVSVTRENIRDTIKTSKLVHRWEDSEEVVVELTTVGFEGLGLPEIYRYSILSNISRVEVIEELFSEIIDSVLEILEQHDYALSIEEIVLGRNGGVSVELFSEQFPDLSLEDLGRLRRDKDHVLVDTYFNPLDEQDALPSYYQRAVNIGHSINTKFVRMSSQPHLTH